MFHHRRISSRVAEAGWHRPAQLFHALRSSSESGTGRGCTEGLETIKTDPDTHRFGPFAHADGRLAPNVSVEQVACTDHLLIDGMSSVRRRAESGRSRVPDDVLRVCTLVESTNVTKK